MELLVTISIIAVLFVLLFPMVRRVRDRANEVRCVSNLKQISTTLLQYAQDHGGNTLAAFNGSGAWMGPLKTYTGWSDAEWKKRMICPSNPRLPFGDGAPYATNYAPSEAPMGYKNSSGSFQMARAGRPSVLAMISDGFVPAGQDENKTHYPRNFFHHMGVNIAFHDGSVRHVAAKDVDLQWWGNSRQ